MSVKILDPKVITRHVARVRVDDLEITYELLDLLEELQHVGDGAFRGLLINDATLGKDLEARGLARRSNRGSYSGGPKLDEWMKVNWVAASQGLVESQKLAYPFRWP
jgi:hypothetical protein